MGRIDQFFDKNITKNKIKISNCERICSKKEVIVKTNEEATTSNFKEGKLKRFICLKFNFQKKPTANKNLDDIEEPEQSCASAVKIQAP